MNKSVHNCPWEQAQGTNSWNLDGWDIYGAGQCPESRGRDICSSAARVEKKQEGVRERWKRKGCLNEHSEGPWWMGNPGLCWVSNGGLLSARGQRSLRRIT